MKSRLLCALIAAVLCPLLSATTTVTGSIKTLGTTSANNSYVRFWLRGCNGNQPRVNGVAIVPSNTNGQFYFDFPSSSTGTITGLLYSTRDAAGTGAGEIDCGGSHTAAWYGMQVYRNSVGGPETPVQAKNTATLDVSNVTPTSTNPVVVAPTGDATYSRIDGGNSPFSGNIGFSAQMNANAGGTLSGTFSGNATLSGNTTLSGSTTTIKGTTTAGIVNGIYYPHVCGLAAPPAWCSGSDIGAWINAAITAGGTRIWVADGNYNQTTTIMLPRNVLVSGSSAFKTAITYTPSSGWAVIVTDTALGAILGGRGGLEDISLYGPTFSASYASQTGGVYLGGSDGTTGGTGTATVTGCTVTGTGFNTLWPVWQPIVINGVTKLIANVASSTSLTLLPSGAGSTCSATSGAWYVTGSPSTLVDPAGQFGDNVVFSRLRLWSFGVGVQAGNRAWLNHFHQCVFIENGTALWIPSTLGGLSGENISFNGGIIGNNGQGLVLARGAAPTDTDIHLFGVSFDYNTGWSIANGDTSATVNLTSDHIEAVAQWAISYGQLYASDSYFTNGTSSGTLGYLIDNENPTSSITNTVLAGAGSGTIFNAAGQLITLAGVQYTTGGAAIGMPVGGAANTTFGDIFPQMQVIGQAKNGFPSQGLGLGWNALGGAGEGDFWNNHGGGSGGWSFFDCSGACNTVPSAAFGISATGGAFPKALTVGTLPSAATGAGGIFYVSDSTAVASEGQTCVGGSTTKALAFSNGSVWKCF